MPLPLIEIPLSVEEYERMPHLIGWKHEYWDGIARLSPAHSAFAKLKRRLYPATDSQEPLALDSKFELRHVQPADEAGLIQLHLQSFEDAVEFAGLDEASYLKQTTNSIQAFFGAVNGSGWAAGDLHGSSLIEVDKKIVAALLLRRDHEGHWELVPIMVAAEYQRLGLAGAMLERTCQWLLETGCEELYSRCHLSNSASLAWHLACEFVELPTTLASNHRAHHHYWMQRHHLAADRTSEAQYHAALAAVYWQLSEVCRELDLKNRLLKIANETSLRDDC